MNDEKFLIQLRDCFAGGYTLPQFCIDNKIRKPLFVAEKKILLFVWEIYVQFRYDKRLTAQFAFLDAPPDEIDFSACGIIAPLKTIYFSEVKPGDCDAVICLTTRKIFGNKAIYLDALINYFIRRTYVEIPLLNFLQRHPQVKLFLTKLPNDLNRYKGGTEFRETLNSVADIEKNIITSAVESIATPLDKLG